MKRLFGPGILLSLAALGSCIIEDHIGWQYLFDGKTLQGWRMVTGRAEFVAEDSAIIGSAVPGSPNSFLITEEEFGNFILELDVKILDSNTHSGIQFRSHFDPQGNNGQGKVIGYQFELDPSSRRWTGGIYDEGRRDWLYPLSLNPSAQPAFRVGVFNHLRLECIGDTIKTWVNGKAAAYLIDTLDRRGFIALQVHSIGSATEAGPKIFWKNIRILTDSPVPIPFPPGIYVVNIVPNYLCDYEISSGWRLLFDGISARHWRGAFLDSFPERGWKVENGSLFLEASGGEPAVHGGDIVTRSEFSSFDLSFDFMLTKGANSGVKYFVTLQDHEKGAAVGLEYQLLDDSLYPEASPGRNADRTLASLDDLIPASPTARLVHPPGQWNSGRIVAYPDKRVEHYLNGLKVVSYVRGSPAFRELVSNSKFRIWPGYGEALSGHILLADQGYSVRFRNIKIRRLSNGVRGEEDIY